MSECPCRKIDLNKLDFNNCCEPYLNGLKKAPTAEALMRSRYSAYTKGLVDYIEQTQISLKPTDFNKDEALLWAQSSEWMGLEIKKTNKGSNSDMTGTVEFIAHYKDKASGKELHHHESALFSKDKDGWKFKEGNILGAEPIKRLDDKIGRNDPCSCGSGKKFKKCCGA